MTEIIENITDKSRFKNIFNEFFLNKNVFIKTSDINIQIIFLEYKEDIITLKIENSITIMETSLIYMRHNDEIICSHVKYLKKDSDTVYSFQPLDIEILKIPRKEERKNVDAVTHESGNRLYVSNIISDFILKDCLLHERRKAEYIKDKILAKLKGQFWFSYLFLANEKSNDVRMKYFYNERKPIFMPDLKKETLNETEIAIYELYKKIIFDSDTRLDWEKVVSEISVPIFYKGMLPIGYLQVNGDAPFTENEFSIIKKFGTTASELYLNSHIIKVSNEKIAVVDLSKNGLGIIFKERILIKYFKDESFILFNIFFPDETMATLLGVVKNINLIGKNVFRIGCEIVEIDSIGEVYYNEFLEQNGQATEAQKSGEKK